MPDKATWTILTQDGDERTESLRVSGGWLYGTRTFEQRRDGSNEGWGWYEVGVALAFQPERPE